MALAGFAVVPRTARCEFGAKTLAGSGGVAPAGVFETAVIVGGNNSGHWQISGNGTLTPTTAGDINDLNGEPYSLEVLLAGAPSVVSIDVVESAYSAATMGEVSAAFSDIGAAGGKSVLLRTGLYAGDATTAKNRAFKSVVSLTPHTGAVATFRSTFFIDNTRNLTIDGLAFYEPLSVVAGTNLIRFKNGPTNIVIKNNSFAGAAINPNGDFSAAPPTNPTGIGRDGSTAPTDVSILDNTFSNLYYGVQISGGGTIRVEGNLFQQNYNDNLQVGYGPGPISTIISDNVFFEIIGVSTDFGGPHADYLQLTGSGVADWTGVEICRNTFISLYGRAKQAMYLGDQTPFFYSGTKIKDNLLVTGGGPTKGIRLTEAKNVEVTFNTVVTQAGQIDGTGIKIGETANSGTQTVKNNVADVYQLTGTYDMSDNVTLGASGATIRYTTAFAGPTFDPISRSEAIKTFTPKSGGPLDGPPKVGAI